MESTNDPKQYIEYLERINAGLLEACKKLLKAGDERDAEQWFNAVVLAKQAIKEA